MKRVTFRLPVLLTIATLLVCSLSWANAAPPPPAAAPAPTAAADANAPDAVVLRALKAGIAGNFEAYLAEVLADRKDTAEQKSQLQRYEFKRFAAQAAWYVADPAKPAITVARRQASSETKVKLFVTDLKNKEAMPRPIELTKKDGRWFISANSL